MNAAELSDLLVRLGSSQELVEWARDRSLTEMWEQCERPDWMLWLCEKMIDEADWPTHQEVVLAACNCAQTVLHIYENKYPQSRVPRKALEVARSWASGRATLEEVRSAVASTKMQISLGSLSLAASNAATAAHDAAAAVSPTYEGAAANAVRAAVAAETGLGVFFRSKIRRKFANLVRKELRIPQGHKVAQTESRKKFASNEVLQSALAIHEALGSWMRMLFAALEEVGTSEEEATLQMSALFVKMEEVSKGYAPAIISLTMTSILTGYIQYLTTEEGDLNGITAELAVAVITPLMSLGDGLDAVLQEEGWKKENIAGQVSVLSKEITRIANGTTPGIAPLTFAFTIDNYTKLLIKGTMTP